ncbi:MAG TPA: nitroreductase family protein [Bacteroidales bacterium]|jgi:nitroreductase|nr:nitroreductase family protein [Bacteroidales bacterium]HPB24520.1 nitroreductase family protein [Bacteroidales bacterium]HPI29163.1 nitroreductase family protein [Bacteroidales bacterium]
MNFLELTKLRQSSRKYEDRLVEREKIARCIEAARLAPSACNSQPWTFVVADQPELKQKIAGETFSSVAPFNRFALQAPVMVAIVTEKPSLLSRFGSRIRNKDFYLFDIGMAAEHFCLQAAEEGLGTCILGWFNEKNVMKLLNIPKNKRVGLLITLGYSTSRIREKTRKPLNKILKYNSYE